MRKAAWRSECSDQCATSQEAALSSQIFILSELGPTCFGIREDRNPQNLQVRIGDLHSCSCGEFRKFKSELCKHICWILLKKFRIPRDDPLSWQTGLVESEIESLLRGYEQRSRRQLAPNPAAQKPGPLANAAEELIPQRLIQKEDICPVCQDDFFGCKLGPPKPVTYCRYSCGNSVHLNCMKLWADHQHPNTELRKLNKETDISCPVCRGKFCTAAILRLEIMTMRDYLAPKSSMPDGTKNTHGISSNTGSNVFPSELPTLINVQSMASKISNQSLTNHSNGESSSNVKAFPNVAFDLTNHQVIGCAKEVRISMKKSKPGLQCVTCLQWFIKGIIVWQLPCRHLFHKHCVDENNAICACCQQSFTLPRSGVIASAPTARNVKKPVKERLLQQASPTSSALHGNRQQFQAADMIVGQFQDTFGSLQLRKVSSVIATKHTAKPAKTRLATTLMRLPRQANGGDLLTPNLPTSFCLLATALNNAAKES